ncbi:MAG: hypothetical protein WAS07_12940 [Micropruina sp.]
MVSTSVASAINLRLALLDLPMAESAEETAGARLVAPIIARQREMSRRLEYRLCATDLRIQTFLDDYLAETGLAPQLPNRTLVLDVPGLARSLSLPSKSDKFTSPLLSSYRLLNGVLHNPANDRRTTAGVFHVAEGGLPIPDDKLAVPKGVFARLLERAITAPADSMVLPFTSDSHPAECFASLLLRPLVVPGVHGFTREKRMEVRFIVPGGLVANLDFVESIFGNGGDPYLPENDASLDPETWTGTTGCVILAPHLTSATKKELGLPHVDQATERQRRDGMCWSDPTEKYNGGQAFKVCARDERGVIVTLIADNYFGYCKKEVKTQISYSANLVGCVEEEHSGGALVFPSYDLGQEFINDFTSREHTLAEVLYRDRDRFDLQPEGHALDRQQSHIVLVPADATYSLRTMSVSWAGAHGRQSIPIRSDKVYLGPDGYRVHMSQRLADRTQWSLIGTSPHSTSCHKPSTVSGGGKSEISKAISDAFIYANAYIPEFERDMQAVADLIARDFSNRFADKSHPADLRPLLGDERSIGSVIKLLTPSPDYTDEYNAWLESIPPHVKEIVFIVKRYYRPQWGADWRSHFSVARINGRHGNFLRLDGEKVSVSMLRVGFEPDGSWRLFSLRPDFSPAIKVQTQDDITASIVTPPSFTGDDTSRKFVANCEQLLFQRPDDAIHRGYDSQAESDIGSAGTFLSNFEPLDHAAARAMRDDAVAFSAFTEPMQRLITTAATMGDQQSPQYFVSSAHPRIVDGKPSKNPRYLQLRPDVVHAEETATAELAVHLAGKVPTDRPAPVPVGVIASGRRNNPPEPGVNPLCAYNPLHFMELPELFIEFISSMTGKSPSTTGAGSEGALTKGPFNALPAIIDLNAALLSYVLTEYDGWVSCAGYVGPRYRVDHDVSLLVPELFSRMTPAERDAHTLIEKGFLEKIEDFEHDGAMVLASRLGYRMTVRMASTYFGRIFMHPHSVFSPDILQPELQDVAVFAEAVNTIVETHQRVAVNYVADGTIALACPPLRALLEIMLEGQTSEGWTLDAPEFRDLFSRESVLASDWYADRVASMQDSQIRRAAAGVDAVADFVGKPRNTSAIQRLNLDERLGELKDELARVSAPEHKAALVGTLGRQVRFS